ncbi:DUF6491 family protein [Hyphobacterium sp.]|jgi:hypothetical protein|uniref:DUF6491 family protein n=1 Tax=Hyphobacterium sp. TaxID=2004662 RepID=UPI003BA98C7C
MKSLIYSALAAAAAFAGPSLAQDASDDAPRCVRLTNINGYTVIDRQHVVLRGGVSRHYLVTTRHSCPGLNFGARIATTFGETETVCPPVVEYLIPDDGFRCAIDTIEEVEDVESARALIEARAAAAGETADNSD